MTDASTPDDGVMVVIDPDLYERFVKYDRMIKSRPDADDFIVDSTPSNIVEIALETFLAGAERAFDEPD